MGQKNLLWETSNPNNGTKNLLRETDNPSNETKDLLWKTNNPSSRTKDLLGETDNPSKEAIDVKIDIKTSLRVVPGCETDTYSDDAYANQVNIVNQCMTLKCIQRSRYFQLRSLKNCISKIAFQKLMQAPRGKQLKFHGNIVNVRACRCY